ncbi:MAG: xanthine dehydrogenase family protein molybdopterin-binding subunit [Acidimicrobiaceae bacterium]|nr:xanthine dehydrogenase family protein molybdopterin-binding subunit [Acidimicrobiaceae bacterium]
MRYVNDVSLPGMTYVAVARSSVPHARIRSIDTSVAASQPGVIGVFTAKDLQVSTYGRSVRDVSVLADDKVRYVGERVAAVVAESRVAAEAAAELVEVTYDELPAVFTAEEAIAPGAPTVHDAPWAYPRAFITEEQGQNRQSVVEEGSLEAVEEALQKSAFVVDETYTTSAIHQGYLEPQACVADVEPSGKVRLWLTNKSPYILRSQIADCLGIEADSIEVQPIALGGDFGGKGSPEEAPLCVALARLVGRPTKMVLRYTEDLLSTDARHPARIYVRIGCDTDGNITAWSQDALLDGGAYGGFKPAPTVSIHGALEPGGYRIPAFYSRSVIAYTNTVPKGHMRAPGAPQATFATESAMDELALKVGLEPADLRYRNLLRTGEADVNGREWIEFRGQETLDAALAALRIREDAPAGWASGVGISVYSRTTPTSTSSSMRLVPMPDGRLSCEIGVIETGTGSHTVARELLAKGLAMLPEDIDVVQVSTDELPTDPGAGGSRVTASLAMVADQAIKAWRARLEDEPVLVVVDEKGGPPVGSYGVQIAQVAVDPETGQVKVLEILSTVDVAEIINEKSHQMQIDGGAAMGFGYACLEDLDESDGQVWSANLGDFKLPSSRDVPDFKTVLVRGGRGVGTANVKNIGETTTPPTAAAIANAVADAVGARIRDLPIRAERVLALIEAAP